MKQIAYAWDEICNHSSMELWQYKRLDHCVGSMSNTNRDGLIYQTIFGFYQYIRIGQNGLYYQH